MSHYFFRKGGVCKNSLGGDMHSHERFLVNNYYEVAMRPKIRGRLIRETAMAPNDSGVEYTTLQYVSIRNKM